MLVKILYHVDEFCKLFEETLKENVIMGQKKQRISTISTLSLSEIVTICVFYHYSGYKNFKTYYKNYVLINMKSDFTKTISYNRFVELQKNAVLPLILFLKIYCKAVQTGISFIDSFSLKICNNRRIHSHKVFKNIAQRGQTSMGCFYGFKVHFIINHLGEIINFYITPGNIADNNTNLLEKLTHNVCGKLFGDKGYIVNKQLFKKLYDRGLQIVTKIRKNMKNTLMDAQDKLILKKRGTIESVIGILKESFNIEHSRHRSPSNFLANTLSALAAYVFKPEKPSIIKAKAINGTA